MPRRRRQSAKPPPRRVAGCGHVVYSWRQFVPRCPDCLRDVGDVLDLVRRDPLRPRRPE